MVLSASFYCSCFKPALIKCNYNCTEGGAMYAEIKALWAKKAVGVNFGIGAHADLGYKDGVIKADVGLSVGLGVSAAVEIDIGGMVNTVVDGAEAVWDGACDLWDSLWS